MRYDAASLAGGRFGLKLPAALLVLCAYAVLLRLLMLPRIFSSSAVCAGRGSVSLMLQPGSTS
jgi:hypothetical protein